LDAIVRRGHMDDDFIVTTFVIVDKLLAALGHRDDVRAGRVTRRC